MWSFCGRAGALAALVLAALVAASVASADPGIGVASSVTAAAAPVTQAVPVPQAPALPTPAAPVPAAPVAVPAAPVVAAPAAPAVPTVPKVAVPKVAVPHVVVGAKAKASVSVSKQHHVTIKSVVTAHAKVGKAHAKVSASSKTQASKSKVVTASRITAANSTGPCAGYPMPPYNCSQVTFDGDFVNTCNTAFVHLMGYYHEIENVQVDPTTGSVIIYHHLNFQKMRGVGTDLNQYTASDVDKDYTEMVPLFPGLAMHIHTEHQEEQELISLGSDPNQLFHVGTVTDVDIDPFGAPGTPTITVSGFGLKCTG
jgi:hypothetical protein